MESQLPNRTVAGRLLASQLTNYAHRSDVIVLALPRGGVPVAFEIAQELGVALDVCVVRKLGVPGKEELAMGAIATGGIRVINQEVVDWLHISPAEIDQVAAAEQKTLQHREQIYRGDRLALDVRERTIILVDDGIATGSTLKAAITALTAQHPQSIVVAVPVAPLSVCRELEREVEEVISLLVPETFRSISLWYEDFSQTTDEEVCSLLANRGGVAP
ncbi:MAG: phosphoribosyltransferase [Cyanophyceae cyanobacterium]